MAPIRSASFDGDVRAPGLARHFAVEAMGERADLDAVDDAATIVSELVTNAVRAGAATIDVSIETDPDSSIVRFVVSDDVAGWPKLRQAKRDEPSGRGLPIIAALASEWGVEKAEGAEPGKRVWATIPVAGSVPGPDPTRPAPEPRHTA